jgi:hypothetical protein
MKSLSVKLQLVQNSISLSKLRIIYLLFVPLIDYVKVCNDALSNIGMHY